MRSGAAHIQANPTLTEKAYKTFMTRKESIQSEFRKKILEQYGGDEHFQRPDFQLLVGQSELYAEYAPDGRIIKGQERAIPKSKYIEDEYNSNHTSVYGSYYDLKTGKWGYACCQNILYNSYCTHDNNQNSNESSNNINNGNMNDDNNNNENDNNEEKRKQHQRVNKSIITAASKPKDNESKEKLINPSGYISTKGILAAKGIARKQALEKKAKQEKRMQKKLLKKIQMQKMNGNNDVNDIIDNINVVNGNDIKNFPPDNKDDNDNNNKNNNN